MCRILQLFIFILVSIFKKQEEKWNSKYTINNFIISVSSHFDPKYQSKICDSKRYHSANSSMCSISYMSRVTCPVSLLTWTQCALVSTCWLLTSVPPHTSSTVPPPSAPTAATQGWLPRTLVCPATMRRAESRSRASPVHCLFGGSVELRRDSELQCRIDERPHRAK